MNTNGYRLPVRICWCFMTAGKFTAIYLHLLRACKSYLRAQKDWRYLDGSQLCPKCNENEETLKHVISKCPALACTRTVYSKLFFNISPKYIVWKEDKNGPQRMKDLILFISLTKMNFPVGSDVVTFTQETQV